MTGRPGRVVVLAVLLAVVTALSCLALVGQLTAPAAALPDAGAFVRVALPVARTVQDLAAALTVGLLVLAGCVLPPGSVDTGDALEGSRARAVRLAAFAAAAWSLSATATLVLTYADAAGLPLGSPGLTSQVGYFLRSFDLGRALGASIILAACVCCGALLTTRQDTVGWLALLSIGALLPLALVGHAAGSATHQASVDGLALHLVGVSVWVGGLAALVLLAPQLAGSLPVSARRYSTIAGWCFALVAVSGLLNAWLRLGSWSGLATPYGALVCVKAGALLVLGFGGWLHRRSTLARLDGPGPARHDFLRLAGAEVLLMAATTGVAVALSRSAPPGTPGQGVGDRVSALLGFDVPEPLTPTRWLTTWSIEPAWAVVCLAGLGWYAAAVGRTTREGSPWPWRRSVAWAGGSVLLLWCTSGALGGYGRLQLSVLMAQHVTMMMVVPMLLVLGAPATLALRTTTPRDDGSRGPHEWLVRFLDSRALSHLTRPVAATSLFVLTPFLLTVEPAFRVAVSTHAGHLVAGALLLGSGYLFAWVLMGLDPGAGRVGGRGAALMLLAAVGGQLAFTTWLYWQDPLAPVWFGSVSGRDLSALAADQRLAAVLVLLLTAVVTLVMGISVGRRRRAALTGHGTDTAGLRTAPGVEPTRSIAAMTSSSESSE